MAHSVHSDGLCIWSILGHLNNEYSSHGKTNSKLGSKIVNDFKHFATLAKFKKLTEQGSVWARQYSTFGSGVPPI